MELLLATRRYSKLGLGPAMVSGALRASEDCTILSCPVAACPGATGTALAKACNDSNRCQPGPQLGLTSLMQRNPVGQNLGVSDSPKATGSKYLAQPGSTLLASRWPWERPSPALSFTSELQAHCREQGATAPGRRAPLADPANHLSFLAQSPGSISAEPPAWGRTSQLCGL